MPTIAFVEARSDHHLATGAPKHFHDTGNIARIVLTVAVDPNNIVISELMSKHVSRLHATTEPEVMRQWKHVRTNGTRDVLGAVERTIVDDQNRSSWEHFMKLVDDSRDGCLFVIGRDDHEEVVWPESAPHNAATLRGLIEYCWSSF